MKSAIPILFFLTFPASGAEPVTLENVTAPTPNDPNEPLAESFSLEKATHYLDSASLNWQKQRKCFTCHTNYAYLYARPSISADSEAHQTVRAFAEALVRDRWEKRGPRWDAEVVATAAALAFNDRVTTGELHPLTKKALDRMWTVQREDGGWTWLDCDWPPMEDDDHYGVTLTALAVGVAPEDYARSESAKKGMAGIRRFLKATPPPMLHHEAMLLWASAHTDDLLPETEKEKIIKRLKRLQKEDGGWAIATLGTWKRGDDKEQDRTTSDGYGTGFVTYVLRQAGVPKEDPAMRRGVLWIKRNQRESGRWFTRSLYRDNKHYISHAGTAFAVMALAACDALKD